MNDYFTHWAAEDWKRLNEQRRRDRERLRQQLAEDAGRMKGEGYVKIEFVQAR